MNKLVKKILITISALIVVVYAAGAFYFSEFSYPNTKVNGNEKGLINLNEIFNVQNDSIKLNIKGRENKSLELNAKDIDLKSKIVDKPVLSQNGFKWPLQIFQQNEYNFKIENEYNKEKLSKILDSSDLFKNMKDPEDAKIIFENNEFKIKEEVLGSRLDKAKVEKSIIEAINSNIEEINLDKEYVTPKILSKDDKILKKMENVKEISKLKYIFDFKDRKWTLEGFELVSKLDETDNGYIVNREKLMDYVADIAIETDTYGESRKFKATGLGEIVVPAGIYGWQMNVAKTVDQLTEMFKEKKSGEVKIIYNLEGYERAKDDIGNSYVEIDLSRQTLWMYINGERILETPIISGDASSRKTATPIGVNKIWSRENDVKLNGTNAISGITYSYPVKYWMPIGWTGSGLHDAYSRKEFGGQIYRENGSNSCINMPTEAAKTVFENSEIDMPVVVYESSTSISPTEFEKQGMIKRGEAEPDVS